MIAYLENLEDQIEFKRKSNSDFEEIKIFEFDLK